MYQRSCQRARTVCIGTRLMQYPIFRTSYSRSSSGDTLKACKENPAYSAEIGNTVDRIIAIENALDAKEFTNASDGFKTLSLGSTPTVPEAASYIELSRALRDDLETYSSIDKEHQRKDLTLIEDVGMIAREATLLEAAKDKPLTLAL